MKAFFSKQLNDYAVEEMCSCGHLKCQHGSLLIRMKKSVLRQATDGSCCVGCCDCKQFTFERYVTAEEVANILINQRPLSA